MPTHEFAQMYDREGNNELAKTYYLIAIDHEIFDAASDLAKLHELEGNYVLAETYYLMAIDNGCTKAIQQLADMHYCQNAYELAEHYYLIAIKYENFCATNLLSIYENQNRYDKIIALNINNHNININEIVHKILNSEIIIDDRAKKALLSFKLYRNCLDDSTEYFTEYFTSHDFCSFKIFKKINVIPLYLTKLNYEAYEFIMSKKFIIGMLIRLKLMIPRVIFVYICRKLFDNKN